MNARISETLALRMAWLRDVVKPSRIAGKLARFLLAGVILFHAVLFVLVLAASLVLLHVNPSVTALMIWRSATAHQKAQPVRFVALQHIPLVARRMVIRLEDYHFYNHVGIDLGAIRDAYLTNRAIGYPLYGGSTIPQQLARNLFLTPRKTYLRKYSEALIAVEMDLLMPKSRILELYLNCIEWGKGVYGIGAASYHYYGTSVAGLSLDELRRLVTIITNPVRFDVTTFSKSRQMRARYDYLLSRFPDRSAEPMEPGPPLASPEPALTAPDRSTAAIQMPVPPAPGL
ncbi:MAG TPA: biosynthetic peptidoglycan transglycosylase [Spirochaetia bacterium]|nr:biosynthetic peptidoglycan transglycosylase [Spirochaetia bacterium]